MDLLQNGPQTQTQAFVISHLTLSLFTAQPDCAETV